MAIKKYHVSKNLFDEQYLNISTTIQYIPINVGNGQFTASTTTPISGNSAALWFLAGNVSSGASGDNNLYNGQNRTVNAIDGYVTIAYRTTSGINPSNYDTIVNLGSTALPYEPYGDSFKNWFYREYGTETETFTSLPKTIIGDGQPISSYTIKGNMTQASQPTPQNPVYPQETGDKTANLCYKTLDQCSINASGEIVEYSGFVVNVAKVTQGTNYSGFGFVYAFYATEPQKGSVAYNNQRIVADLLNVTAPIDGYVAIRANDTANSNMINEGSTVKPQEPYGYKIPISFGQGTYTNYLSEPIRKIGTNVDTAASTGTATRAVRKIVLDGTDSSISTTTAITGYVKISIQLANQTKAVADTALCSHASYSQNTGVFNTAWYIYLALEESVVGGSTIADVNTYLAAQYANGTPVTIWYVLATAQTESFTAPTIPTSGTAQTFDVDTTLKPSEVSLTWHGWHEHSDEKYVGGVVNKFNKDATNTSNGYVNNAYILSNGNVYESDGYSISEYIPVKPSQSYTLVYGNSLSRPSICFYNSNHEFISGTNYNGSSTITFTTTANIAYCRLSYANNLSGAVMLNEGSTALPYHPYYEWVEQ